MARSACSRPTWIVLVIAVLVNSQPSKSRAEAPPLDLRPPAADGIWLRPSKEWPAQPTIGFRDGIQIALWPTRGPRGVIRVLAPYVCPGQDYPVVNFIAIEPIVGGQRSYSEIEHSSLDDRHGKRLWLSDELGQSSEPKVPWNPARGKTRKIWVGGTRIETLSVVLNVEKLDNGAHPAILVTFRSDRPNEIGFKIYALPDSAPMESCVLSATMGNYSRARLLWLKDEVIDARKIWPKYKGDDFVFTEDIPGERIRKDADGTLTVAITPSESDLAAAKMPSGGWTFDGKVSTQYWRKYPKTAKSDLRVRVNGRAKYYRTDVLIPGGVSYENFELIERFEPGIESWFGVTLKTPREMGWK
jgi:hypothetical protein